MKIKVCGMREADNISEVEALGIDMMGFIFWPKSSRFVADVPTYLPTRCKRVGVFVDASIDEVMQKTEAFGLDIIQLHGHESPEYIQKLTSPSVFPSPPRGETSPSVFPSPPRGGARGGVIKALNIATPTDLHQTKLYEGIVDAFLFDTKGKSVGGNGEKFDWHVLDYYQGDTPFILSGGIGPDDAERVKAFEHSNCIGIDLNSRFESAPGLKDINKLKEFIKQLAI